MENRKRVYCLYRVSKHIQVDKVADDIPMQKQACREFAEQQGWEIVREFYEKGVSGFSVSSAKRDAILEIQREAALGNFDILLVFLFDRLGRRDDETPFIVEWFIRNNIAVWSVNEGEQRMDSHVDKLLNYIRYWEASGESIKMGVRVKAGIAEIAKKGWFAGGIVPYGYRLVKSERLNAHGRVSWDCVVDEKAVEMVKDIFSKYANEGYGCQSLARYLHAHGAVKPNGKVFNQQNVTKMLKNELYLGYVKRGETCVHVPALQIVDKDIFNKAMMVRDARNKRMNKIGRTRKPTKSISLLSGKVYCGHCGYKLTFSANGSPNRNKKTGEITGYNEAGYVCSHGQGMGGSTCQQRYASKRVDKAVRSVLKQIFEQIHDMPPAHARENRHERTELARKIKTVTRSVTKLTKDLAAYKGEVIIVLQGNSAFTAEILNQLIYATDAELAKQIVERDSLQAEQDEINSLSEKKKAEHMQILSWSEVFDESSLETQMMVVSSLINEVRLWKGYRMEIDLNVSIKEFVDGLTLEHEHIKVSTDEPKS